MEACSQTDKQSESKEEGNEQVTGNRKTINKLKMLTCEASWIITKPAYWHTNTKWKLGNVLKSLGFVCLGEEAQ